MHKNNRLFNEKSPYLLQHANNPVDWFPWSEEAFKKAEEEDKPVFLSIGYSTCHWCHVMEKESFEDSEIASLMNEAFVSVKVDREERPDIDNIYMTVCQVLTGSGGWPLTIIMTPEKKPFFAGTYFPKDSRFGRMGMKDLVPRIKELWKTKKDEIINSAESISSMLINASRSEQDGQFTPEIFDEAYNELEKRFDPDYGGFSISPKFPTPHNFLFLLRYHKRKTQGRALEMVEKSLSAMRNGGIFDHIGYGFHRYSTDEKWLVPHFEKMLYDQALLAEAFIETYQVTNNDFYKNTAEKIFEYVMHAMTSPEGGFYSAEDADSEGEEGKFYLWKTEEVKSILKDDSDLIIKVFNMKDEGNWFDPVHGGLNGTNILYLEKDFNVVALELNISPEQLENVVKEARKKLFYYRENRVHPLKDDKILADWNGLMISAFAKASEVFDKPEYLNYAEKAAAFILNNLYDSSGKLFHRFRNGEAAFYGSIDDYSFFTAALIDLYEATFKIQYLEKALILTEEMLKYYWDDERGGFYFTPNYGEKLLLRGKEVYDGAVPSGNSAALLNLLKLSRITSDAVLGEKASRLAGAFYSTVKNSPSAFTRFLSSLDYVLGESFEIIISGEKGSADTSAMIREIRNHFIPNKVLIMNDKNDTGISRLIPFIKNYSMTDNEPAVYICKNYVCGLPVKDIGSLRKALSAGSF